VINVRHDGTHSLSTVWKRLTRTTPLFRSWAIFEARAPEPLYSQTIYQHPKPSPRYFDAQRTLGRLQGRRGLWLAGMYMHDVDSHESAIMSAVNVARALHPASENLARLRIPVARPITPETASPPQVPGTQR
jgi:predicted NAD/FAD-binding protein